MASGIACLQHCSLGRCGHSRDAKRCHASFKDRKIWCQLLTAVWFVFQCFDRSWVLCSLGCPHSVSQVRMSWHWSSHVGIRSLDARPAKEAWAMRGFSSRLTAIGWIHLRATIFLDQDGGQIDIYHCPVQELKQRAKRAWRQSVGASMAYRRGFKGLQHVDVVTSTQPVPTWTPDEAGLIRALLNGSFFTQDQLQMAKQVDSKACRFCGLDDSLQHRHWECEHTAHLRQGLSKTLLGHVPLWPECTRERGWFVEPPSFGSFKALLAEVPLITHQRTQPVPEKLVMDLFTDGRLPVTRPSHRSISHMGCGCWFGHRWTSEFRVFAGRGLPGQWQTSLRAELTAVIMAVTFSIQKRQSARLWCDNATVVRRMQQLQAGAISLRPSMSDHDLWSLLHSLLHDAPVDIWIFKVASHQEDPLDDDFLCWVFAGNRSADFHALLVMTQLPEPLLQVQAEHAEDVRVNRRCNKNFTRTLPRYRPLCQCNGLMILPRIHP